MNYEESRAYIRAAELKKGIVLGLENMRELMRRLGDPQDELKYVHVAGTNGKGSVIAYLYSALSGAGYRVGRYISPAVYSYRERMEVNGEPVSREKFAAYVTRIAEVIDEIVKEGKPHPSVFEIETAAAFLYFRDEKCDLVLMEVGMGGDLDATNIISTTVLSILVSISMDHTAFLGNTLGEIAEKKAGIIKPNSHMVTVKQQPEAEAVIRRICAEQNVPYEAADRDSAEVLEASITGQTFLYKGEKFVQSNAESGDGFVDILAEPEDPDAGIVIELKYSQTFSGLQNACERALAQIREKRYDERLRNEGRNNILAYGVAFCKKRCKVAVQRL